MSFARSVFLFSWVALAACSSSSRDDVATSASRAAIISGETSGGDQDFVVQLFHELSAEAIYSCTGTLIADNLVLTARHCVASISDGTSLCSDTNELSFGAKGGKYGADWDPASIYVFTGNQNPPIPSADALFAKAAARGTSIFHDDGKIICGHDIALLVLDQPIENAKLAPIRLDAPPVDGELFTQIGWGTTTTEEFPALRQQRKDLAVTHVGPFAGDGGPLTTVGPGDFASDEGGCSGDSGGPAISQTSNAVFGVYSRGGNGQPDGADPAAPCKGAENLFASVASAKDTILAAFQAAGREPWLEGQAAPPPATPDDASVAIAPADSPSEPSSSSSGCAVARAPSESRSSWLASLVAVLVVGARATRARRRRRDERKS